MHGLILKNFNPATKLPWHRGEVPNASSIHTMTEKEFNATPQVKLQALMKHFHVLVTDCDFDEVLMNEEGLSSFTNIHRNTTMYGKSVDS